MCDEHVLRKIAASHLGIAEQGARFERINTGLFNTSHFIITPAGEHVLRIAPPDDAEFCFYERKMMRQEPAIHRMLRQKTNVPVARIVVFDDSHDLIDRDFMIMERIPGMPLSEARGIDVEGVFTQVGKMLAECHSQTTDTYGYLGEHAPMVPQKDWAGAFAVMWEGMLEDVARVGYYDLQERTAFSELLRRHKAQFDRQVDSSLLHMDIWHQNILVDDGDRVTGILDWDRALWGDPEIEFAVLDYCGVSTPGFWRGYGRERDTSQSAMVRRAFYLLYEMQKYIVIAHGRSHDPAGAMKHKQQVLAAARDAFG